MRALLLGLLVLGGDQFQAGVAAYREGRFQDALVAFTAAEQAAGERASPELLYNVALAALRAGRLERAEAAAEQAAARGGAQFTARRDFLLGSAAFSRSERAEAAAMLPDAEPRAFDTAITAAAAALQRWQRAATSRADWPAARRNVERALRKIDDLKNKQAEAEQNRPEPRREGVPLPLPDPRDPTDPGAAQQEAVVPGAVTAELTADQLLRLLEKLGEKERQKLALRRAQQRQRQQVERDW